MTAQEPTETPKILIVDDDPLMVHALAAALKPLGKVSFTTDFDLVHVTVALARPKVLLLDVDLPGVTGLEIARRIRENPDLDDTQVVLMTAHRCGSVLHEAESLVGDRVMLKPIDLGAISDKVGGMLSLSPSAQPGRMHH